MKKKEIWNFEYKGIRCEIVHWGVDEMSFTPNGIWNGYILVEKKQLPGSFRKLLCDIKTYPKFKRKYWNYFKLEKYFNMHGGLTYYELIRDEFLGKPLAVKVGCDYAHFWDVETYINEDVLKEDLQNSVDTFIEHFPNYLVWRNTDGKYVKPIK